MNATEYKYRFTFKRTARVIMTFYWHIWKLTPFVLIDIEYFSWGSITKSTSSDHNILISYSTSRMSMSWVTHVGSILKYKSIALLLKFTTLVMWFCSRIIKIASSNHKHLALRRSNLDNLEVMWEHIIRTFSVFRVDIVSCYVGKVEFLAWPCK